MYRLLIVDDEPLIAEGLFQLFREKGWPELDVCKAYSGVEAVGILKTVRIDIVLTDIRMPGLNGLQLLQRITQYWPLCRVILLTGYSEFEYVYTAIHTPGVNYLLKNESDGEILQAVRRMLDEIIAEDKKRSLLRGYQKQMQMAALLIRQEFLGALLAGGRMPAPERKQRFGELGIGLDSCRPVVLTVGCIYAAENAAYGEKKRIFSAVSGILQDSVAPMAQSETVRFENAAVCLTQPHAKDEPAGAGPIGPADFPGYIRAGLESVQETLKKSTGYAASFAVSAQPVDWLTVKEEFDSLHGLLSRAAMTGHEMVIMGGTKSRDELPAGPGSDKKSNTAAVVGKINRYIADNLNRDLSLARIAENVYFNPSYLSRFYKQATGQNLFDYINRAKYKKACRLLRDNHLKINEIGSMVGFKSPSYFTALFKKMAGMTPEEYRNSVYNANM